MNLSLFELVECLPDGTPADKRSPDVRELFGIWTVEHGAPLSPVLAWRALVGPVRSIRPPMLGVTPDRPVFAVAVSARAEIRSATDPEWPASFGFLSPVVRGWLVQPSAGPEERRLPPPSMVAHEPPDGPAALWAAHGWWGSPLPAIGRFLVGGHEHVRTPAPDGGSMRWLDDYDLQSAALRLTLEAMARESSPIPGALRAPTPARDPWPIGTPWPDLADVEAAPNVVHLNPRGTP